MDTFAPEVLWGQRSDTVYLTVNLSDATIERLNLTDTRIEFEGYANEVAYAFEFDLYAEVESESARQRMSDQKIELILPKKQKAEWPRPNDGTKMSYIKPDPERFSGEDETG